MRVSTLLVSQHRSPKAVEQNKWTKQKRILLRPCSAEGARFTYRIVYTHRLLLDGSTNPQKGRVSISTTTRNWGSMHCMEVNYYVVEWFVFTILPRRRESCDQAGLHRKVPPFPPAPNLGTDVQVSFFYASRLNG